MAQRHNLDNTEVQLLGTTSHAEIAPSSKPHTIPDTTGSTYVTVSTIHHTHVHLPGQHRLQPTASSQANHTLAPGRCPYQPATKPGATDTVPPTAHVCTIVHAAAVHTVSIPCCVKLPDCAQRAPQGSAYRCTSAATTQLRLYPFLLS